MYSIRRLTSGLASKSSIETLLIELKHIYMYFIIRSLYSSTVQAEILMDGSD